MTLKFLASRSKLDAMMDVANGATVASTFTSHLQQPHPPGCPIQTVHSDKELYTSRSSRSLNMTDKLPPNLLALFAPRPALRWVPPSDHAPQDRKTATISGLAAFLPALEEYKATDEYEATESWLQRKDRVRLEKKEAQEKLLKEGPSDCETPLRGVRCCHPNSCSRL